MNEFQKLEQINDLIEYFAKGKHNKMAENAMREMLAAIPDRDFEKAVSRLYTVSNRFGLDLSAIKSVLADIGARADDTFIPQGIEVQCDCCGHHYLWSQVADDYVNAEKNWWAYCPVCGLNGDVQADAHRYIARTGTIPSAYLAMLDRRYQHYAERDFRPIKTRAEVKAMLENKNRGQDRVAIQAKLMELEQSYKDRVKKYKDRVEQSTRVTV